MLLSKVTYSAFRLYIFNQYMCSLGIEPTTFCAADAMLYHWATGTHYVCIKVKLDVLCLVPQSVFVRAVRCSPTACRLVLTPARLLVLRRRVSVGTSVWGGASVSRVCTCTRVSVCDGTTVPASTDVTATAQETPSDSAATPGESNISVLTETTGDSVLRFGVCSFLRGPQLYSRLMFLLKEKNSWLCQILNTLVLF